jgi:endo-1,4-beta-xylanase
MNGPPTHPARSRGRSRLRLFLGACAAALAGATAMVAAPGIAHAALCSNQTGTTNGYYYQMWSNGQGSACINVGSGGNQYSTNWSGIGDFVAGVGWNPGSNQTVSFSGSLSASGGTALASLYGWSTSPLVEYYVIEDDQGGSPSLGTLMGTTTSDGATYNLYEHQQVNQPCITGNSCTFEQYLAIRQGSATSGTITTQNIFNAWASHGMNLGSLNYQIFATEAWGGGSGSSNFTVSHGSSGGSGGGGGGGSGGGGSGGGGSGSCTATLSAGTKGSNWYNLNVAVSGSSTWTVTVNMVAPSVVYSTSNVNATWPSQYVMKATPGSGGNNWSFTVSTNGTWTWPSVSCSTG